MLKKRSPLQVDEPTAFMLTSPFGKTVLTCAECNETGECFVFGNTPKAFKNAANLNEI